MLLALLLALRLFSGQIRARSFATLHKQTTKNIAEPKDIKSHPIHDSGDQNTYDMTGEHEHDAT